MRHPGELTGATQRPTQVERFQHVHDFLARLHWNTPPRWTPTGNGLQRGQLRWPPAGSYMATTGQDPMAADTVWAEDPAEASTPPGPTTLRCRDRLAASPPSSRSCAAV